MVRYSPDGRWWWDGSGWRPVVGSASPSGALGRYSPDGRWWWDGSGWRPVVPPSRPRTPGGVIVHVALALALLAGFVAVMMLIGVADLRQSGHAFGTAEVITAVVVGAPAVVLGSIAFLRLPRRDGLRFEAAAAVILGLGVTLFLIGVMFV